MRAPSLDLRKALAAVAALVLALGAATAAASPIQFLPVGDPLESELRILDLLDHGAERARLRLPHLHSRPLQLEELPAPGDSGVGDDPRANLSARRIQRWLARDFAVEPGATAVPGTTPRLVQILTPDSARVEFSAGAAGRIEFHDDRGHLLPDGGARLRTGVQVGRFLAYTDFVVGVVDSIRFVSDPLVPDTDVAVNAVESYLAWASPGDALGVQAGFGRQHWGPGEEAGLLLSRTSVPVGGLGIRAGVRSLGLDFRTYSATLARTAGRQLAAHRIEWQPIDRLRLGIGEAAVYHAPSWNFLYTVGVIPYSVVQRLENQSEPDSAAKTRNNVIAAVDAAWRLADGKRIYGEVVFDDLHVKTAEIPNKWGYLLGAEGVGMVGRSRVNWSASFARLSRYVYTSFYDATFEAGGRPLGYPTGPDSRRKLVRASCDVGAAWQGFASAAQTDHGEGSLSVPFVPGNTYGDAFTFEGVVETTRELEGGVRWWPASGVDVALSGGWRWSRNAGHVTGADSDAPFAAITLDLAR